LSQILNIENPNLSTHWTDAELAEQVSQWQAITDISSVIAAMADDSHWEHLLPLAETRQTLIDQFFQLSICVPLFQQIMLDLDEIQAQHKHVLGRVQTGLDHNQAKEDALKETRVAIDGVFPRSP
jgi:hypothetical protein